MEILNTDVVVRVTLTKDCIVPQEDLSRFLETMQRRPRERWSLRHYGIGDTQLVVGTEQIGALGDLDETYREYFLPK